MILVLVICHCFHLLYRSSQMTWLSERVIYSFKTSSYYTHFLKKYLKIIKTKSSCAGSQNLFRARDMKILYTHFVSRAKIMKKRSWRENICCKSRLFLPSFNGLGLSQVEHTSNWVMLYGSLSHEHCLQDHVEKIWS